MDIEQFISSRKSRLNEEKARLSEDRRQQRISPSEMTLYQKPDGHPLPTRAPAKSVAEVRRQMSRERDSELLSYESARTGREISERRGISHRGPPDDIHDNPPREGYLSMREKRLAEERQYQDQMYKNPELDAYSSDFSRRRKQWDENPLENRTVRFKDDSAPYNMRNRTQRWDEEERELLQWAKSQGRLNDGRPRYRAPTPPIYVSPQKRERERESEGHKSLRSISAPVVAEGIAALGARDDTQTRQMKQKKYAEELRVQIREKEEAKRRERMDEHAIKTSSTLGSNTTERPKNTSEFVSEAPKHTTVREDEYEQHYEQHDYRERGRNKRDYPRRPPQSPTHNVGRYDRYSPYPPPHGYHPHLNPYHNELPSWVPPYYRPPYTFHPHMEYPPHPPDPYYHLPLHMGNPYLPLRRPEPWDMEYENRGRRGMEMSEAKDPRSKKEDQLLRRSDDDGEEFISPIAGRSSKTPKQTKASYRAELEKQMKEKKEKETKKQLEKERFELKKETEIYDPWGKGGCGAPVRDRRGNLVADLKKMRKLNNERLMCTSTSPQRPQTTAEDGSGVTDEGSTDTTTQMSPYTYDWKQNEEEQKKVVLDGYRDFLRQQVEEKEAMKRKEKELKRQEEQKEIERLEQERKKLQEDYAREQEAQRRKEEELRAKNEALKREAEEKRREAALMKRQEELEEAEREQAEMNRALTERLQQPLPPPRTKSPPIPVIKHRMDQGYLPLPPSSTDDIIDYHQPEYRSSSPPVPTVRRKLMNQEKAPSHPPQEATVPRSSSPPVPTLRKRMQSEVKLEPPKLVTEPRSRAEQNITVLEPRQQESKSSDLLRQLSAIRRHLVTEKDKLSKKPILLDRNHKDEDTTSHRSEEIFDMARVQKPRMVLPRSRPPPKLGAAPKDSVAISDALRDFTALRENTTQREFLREFPEPPLSEGEFVAQQNALMTHQEVKLAELRSDRRSKKENVPLFHEGSNLLASCSTQVPLSSGSVFTGDSSRVYTRDQAAPGPHVSRLRGRRHWHLDPTPPPHPHRHRVPSAGGQSQFSVATLDVDSMARQNEERKRRLDAILNASAGNAQEPQAILQNFLNRTDKPQFIDGRSVTRQSEKSLDCETQFHPIASARI